MQNIAIILAGGKGNRMMSKGNKVLLNVCGKPIVKHIVDKVKNLNVDKIIVVVGYDKENVIDVLKNDCEFVEQKEQLGTGHALVTAWQKITKNTDNILLLNGDGPILSKGILQEMLNMQKCDLKVLTTNLDFDNSFGKIIRDKNNQVKGIVEAKDCEKNQYKIDEINLGVYCFKNTILSKYIANLSNINAQNEYYVTDFVRIFYDNNYKIDSLNIDKNSFIPSCNNYFELEKTESILQSLINDNMLFNGVRLIDKKSIFIDIQNIIKKGVIIYPNVYLKKDNILNEDVTILPNCYIENCIIKRGVTIGQNSVLLNSVIGCDVQPCSYIKNRTD